MVDQPAPLGVAIVDKPAGWTSHDVVARSRRLLGTRKVGHAGTLDPDATGVLVLGVGRATKLLRYLSPLGKSYVGEMTLGTETSTLDASGDVVATHDMGDVGLDDVVAAASRFRGEIDQVPPMVSAVKVGGRRLHEIARTGEVVDRPARRVKVTRLDVGATDRPNVFQLTVDCSSGTYIRSLAADIGSALGGGAHLSYLRRTAVGLYTLDEAVDLEALGPDDVLPPLDAVRHLDRVDIGDDVAAGVRVGKVFSLDDLAVSGEGPWAVVGEGSLLAVYETHKPGQVKPAVVLAG